MIPSVEEVMEVLRTISNEAELRVTVNESVKGGLWAGGGAIIGGLLAGPVGIAIGGAIGSVTGAATANNFKPVSEVIRTLPAHKQQELYARCLHLISGFEKRDALVLLAFVRGNVGLEKQLLATLVNYLTKDVGWKMHDA